MTVKQDMARIPMKRPQGTLVRGENGIVIFPGFCDVHVHFREPGFSYKETIRTGTAAAARGGYTTVCPMPNLDPVPDSAAHLEEELSAIRRDALVDTVPYGAITVGEKGESTAIHGRYVSRKIHGLTESSSVSQCQASAPSVSR